MVQDEIGSLSNEVELPTSVVFKRPSLSRAPECELRLVESFEFRRRGELVAIPRNAQRPLAFLALHNRPLRRVFVAGSLWPDESDERAGARLRGALCKLRRVGVDVILGIGDQLRIHPALVVDVHEITASLGLLADSTRIPADCASWLSALSGELLSDWYDEWLLVERERFRQLRLHALDELCEGLARTGRFALAVQAGLAAVAADPLRESGQRALIHAHLQEGNPSEALHQYRCYERAAEEMGLSPTQHLEELVQPLLSSEPRRPLSRGAST
jgi:DNA-binding SARP family transcriptional activator